MTATLDIWEPPAVAALGRLDPTLSGLLGTMPTASTGPGWQLHDVRWTPGQTCDFTYRVEAEDRRPTFVAVQVTGAGWTTHDYLEDTSLPGLLRATDPAHVAERLGRVCGQPVRGCRIEAVRYRPGSRCVLRYEVETTGDPVTLYAKAFQPETFARLVPMASALAGTPSAFGLVPPLGEIWSDLRVMVGRAVVGRPLSVVLTDALLPVDERIRLGYGLGEMLARLHGQRGVTAPTWTAEDQIEALVRAMAAVEVADPQFAARLRTLLATLAATVPCSGQDVLAHGSFRPAQVILTRAGQLTVLDTDGVCRSDPGLDLGVALAHLRWQAVRQPPERQALREAERLLLAGYERVAGPVNQDALLWWRAAGLLQVAVHRYRRLEVSAWSQTHMLADAAERLFVRHRSGNGWSATTEVLDRQRMAQELAQALVPAGASPLRLEVDSAEELGTAADRRTVVRYQVRGLDGTEPVAVIGKVFADERRARLLYDHLTVLTAGAFRSGPLRVPEPLGLLPRDRMVVYRHFEGIQLDRVGDAHQVEEGVQDAARWLTRLHTSELLLTRRFSLDQESASGLEWANEIGRAYPDVARQARWVANRWVRRARADGVVTDVPIHKDFHAGHVLLGDGVCVIDLDEARLGDPALDVAHFCAYLELREDAETAARLRRCFLDEYVAGGAPIDPTAFGVFSGYAWLKIAKQWAVGSGPAQGSPSARRIGVRRALARAEARLSE